MTTLAAIETNYAGCRFRSRLEARWAVFFDSLGVDWLYEPQGYTVGPDATPYLPDFWLPTMRLWVEVKGQLEPDELRTLIWACGPVGLPTEPDKDRDLEMFPIRKRMLLLSEIPAPGEAWIHTRIDATRELVVWQGVILWPTKKGPIGTVEMFGWGPLNHYIAGTEATAGERRTLIDGNRCPLPLSAHPRVSDAYRAARSARFEHGESGGAA